MPIRVAVIGAGSVGFSRKLIQDILSVPELADAELALMDINQQNLDLVALLVQRDVEANKLPAKVSSTTDRRAGDPMAPTTSSTPRASAGWRPSSSTSTSR